MLEMTLRTNFIPGVNLKGDVAGANWSFLLSHLEVEQTVCLGLPPAAWLPTLARLSGEVVVVCASGRQLQQARAVIQRQGFVRTRAILAANWAELPFPAGSADLVTLASGNDGRRLHRDQALLAELGRVLKPNGLIYVELEGETLNNLSEGFGPPQWFWLRPESGEAHTAVLQRDPETIRYFLQPQPAGRSLNLRLGKPVTWLRSIKAGLGLLRALWRGRRRLRSAPRAGAFITRGRVGLGPQPPHYLCSLAEQAGVDITSCRWGLSASGDYTSRKVLFFLFKPGSPSPDYVVKIVRDPALNPRLENENRALALLWEKGLGEPGRLPRVMFFGQHAHLAILGETMLEGVSFRQRTQATAGCPCARAAVDWLTTLGAATADPAAAAPGQVAEALETLFARFLQLYSLPPDQRLFLAKQIRTIAHSRAPLPLVFQHGDPGLWNLLVTPRGQVAFLDWEAAEPQGLPLWDLLYFLRSYSVWTARASGTRDSLAGFAQQFLGRSPLTPLIIISIQRYCERIELPPSLIAPLFYTCWMHRALKEATRLTSDRLEGGHYVRLLRLCIERRQASILNQVFSMTTWTGSQFSTNRALEESHHGA